MTVSAEAFLRRHDMYYEQMPFEALAELYRTEMKAGLEGRPSSLYMLPSFIRSDAEPRRGESVLVLDAGGTNLRAGRMHFDEARRPVLEALKKRHMPGTFGEEITAEEMFRQIAAFAADLAEGCACACISFSYPCRSLPDGDGEILELCKEVQVSGAEGRLVCASLEAALKAMGISGCRRWRLVNDSVGSLLGGMAAHRENAADYIGFIMGTGVNSCCRVPSAWITKSPEAMAAGGEMIVNMESGCFGRLLQGTADRELDAASETPGDHPAEKMIAGSYYRQLLGLTLALAVREGALRWQMPGDPASWITAPAIDQFCLDPLGDNPLARIFDTAEDRRFAWAVNDALLERSARVAAAGMYAVMRMKELPRGSRVIICADGSMIRLNPVLRPKMEKYLDEYALGGLGVKAEFRFAEDATLLGCAWAGLL